jgi:mandelate racemase
MQTPSLTFKGIRTRPVVLQLKRPVVARIATITDWPVVLIDLYTEEVVVGRSYLEPYIVKSMRYLIAAEKTSAKCSRAVNWPPRALRHRSEIPAFYRLRRLVNHCCLGFGHGGVGRFGQGRRPTALRFVGWSVGSVRSYNSNGLWLQEPAAVAAEAIALRDEGNFSGLKLRLGRADVGDDLATIEATRKAVGDDIQLMVDFNQGLNLAEALRTCHLIDDLGLAWIEEPLVYHNFNGFARLAAELKTPIQIGENFYGVGDLCRALEAKACDLVMPDFMRIGGVTGWLRAAAMAGAAGVPMSTRLYPEVAAQVMPVTETAHWLEWQDWVYPILQQPYEVKDGLMYTPNVPGVGLEWDEGAVATNANSRQMAN